MAIAIKGGTYDPCPEGEHNAVLVDVVDLGIVETTYKGVTKKQPKITLAWQTDQLDEKGLPFLVFKRYTASLHEKSVLFQDLKRWFRGPDFIKTVEAVRKDVEFLLGKGCRMDVIHNEKDGKTYANVDSIKPLSAGQQAPKQHPDFIRKKDRREDDGPFGPKGGGQRDNVSDPDAVSDEDVPF
jgi:hypothetical protein